MLLFGAETWVLTPRIDRYLDSFQHRAARRNTGRQLRRRGDGIWKYPPLAEAMGEAGFKGIRKSVTSRQNTVAQYIVTRPILDLCECSTRRPGVRVSRRWWKQAGIDLEEAKKATVSELELESESELD